MLKATCWLAGVAVVLLAAPAAGAEGSPSPSGTIPGEISVYPGDAVRDAAYFMLTDHVTAHSAPLDQPGSVVGRPVADGPIQCRAEAGGIICSAAP